MCSCENVIAPAVVAAEDARVMLDQAVADMGADLLKLRKTLAEVWSLLATTAPSLHVY
jgi:phage shock protein A